MPFFKQKIDFWPQKQISFRSMHQTSLLPCQSKSFFSQNPTNTRQSALSQPPIALKPLASHWLLLEPWVLAFVRARREPNARSNRPCIEAVTKLGTDIITITNQAFRSAHKSQRKIQFGFSALESNSSLSRFAVSTFFQPKWMYTN